jgi:hypothetical protein
MNKEEREERGVRPDVRESYAFWQSFQIRGNLFLFGVTRASVKRQGDGRIVAVIR